MEAVKSEEIKEPYMVFNAKGLGQALRNFRKQAGLTQVELADSLGMRQSYISDLESGKITVQTERLVNLLKFLDVRIVLGKVNE